MKYILGLDPGMTHTGYAVLEVDEAQPWRVIDFGEVNLGTFKGVAIFSAVLGFCRVRGKDFVGSYHEHNPFTLAHGRSDATGGKIRRGQSGAVGMLRGLLVALGLKPSKPLNGMTVKKQFATNGRASKELVIWYANVRYGVEVTEHAADALAVAHLAGLQWITKQAQGKTPKKTAHKPLQGRDNVQMAVSTKEGKSTRQRGASVV